MPALSILLSTFNGEKFLREQLDSLLAQSFEDWILLIRDDCSSDGTVSILEEYQRKKPNRIFIVPNAGENKGAKMSFSTLLKQVNTPYVTFCDQDDVWNSNKLELQMRRMREAESVYTEQTPVVVFSDLEVVDQNLTQIASSFLSFSGLSSSFAKNNTILFRNVAPGCSMLMNRALVVMAGEIPAGAVMHDYWLMLVARYRGRIEFVEGKLVKYRQHVNNELGARINVSVSWSQVFKNFWWYLKGATFYLDRFIPYQKQASALIERFPDSARELAAVNAFISLRPEVARMRRKWNIVRYGLKAGKFRENIELFLCA